MHPKEGGTGAAVWVIRNDGNYEDGGDYVIHFKSTDTSKTVIKEAANLIKPNTLLVNFSTRSLPDWASKKAFMNFRVTIYRSGASVPTPKTLSFTWANYFVITKTQSSIMKLLPGIYPTDSFLPVNQKEIDDFHFYCLTANTDMLTSTF